MVSFGAKAKIKKAGNSNQGLSYVITTVSCMIFTSFKLEFAIFNLSSVSLLLDSLFWSNLIVDSHTFLVYIETIFWKMSAIFQHRKSCENEALCIALPSATPTSTNFAKNVTVHATFVTKVQFTLYHRWITYLG